MAKEYPKWEYKVIEFGTFLEIMIELGENGWSIVGVGNAAVFLQRPKKNDACSGEGYMFSWGTTENEYVIYAPNGEKIDPRILIKMLDELND